jgi:hypothetical protein
MKILEPPAFLGGGFIVPVDVGVISLESLAESDVFLGWTPLLDGLGLSGIPAL